MNTEDITEIAHALHVRSCQLFGDLTHSPYRDNESEAMARFRAGIEFHLENPKASAQDAHASWMAARKAEGWTFGEKKDLRERRHPMLVPWADVPQHRRLQYELIATVVRTLRARTSQ
jgi:RyR domain